MRTSKTLVILTIILAVCFISTSALAGHGPKSSPPKPVIKDGDTINIAGIILDTHKEPIDEAELRVLVNSKEVDRVITSKAIW